MVTLFGPEPDPPKIDDTITWTDLARTTQHRCDVCVERTYRQPWAAINKAKLKRRQGHRERMFCAEHAHDVRMNDEERRP